MRRIEARHVFSVLKERKEVHFTYIRYIYAVVDEVDEVHKTWVDLLYVKLIKTNRNKRATQKS